LCPGRTDRAEYMPHPFPVCSFLRNGVPGALQVGHWRPAARTGDKYFLEKKMEHSYGVLIVSFCFIGNSGSLAELTEKTYATFSECSLTAVLNSFGGLSITDKGIVQFKTTLPKKWKSLQL